jgi:hypothetical protein
MSDEWSICPQCGAFDVGFVEMEDKEGFFECPFCKSEVREDEILWKYWEREE